MGWLRHFITLCLVVSKVLNNAPKLIIIQYVLPFQEPGPEKKLNLLCPVQELDICVQNCRKTEESRASVCLFWVNEEVFLMAMQSISAHSTRGMDASMALGSGASRYECDVAG